MHVNAAYIDVVCVFVEAVWTPPVHEWMGNPKPIYFHTNFNKS